MKTCLLMLLACLLMAGPARAGDVAPQEDLYPLAMQAIAEGRNGDASQILARMIARGPSNAGDWLDLALIQCALGHGAEAEALFNDIEQRYAPPKGIMDIIAQQRAQGCLSAKPLSQWSLMVARGADSNVNQGASSPFYVGDNGIPLELLPEYRPHRDRYTMLSGDYLTELDQNGDLGFVQLHLRQNDHEDNYNTASVFAGAEHPWRWGRWKMRGSGLLGMLTLGGRLYQEQAQAQLRVDPPLGLPDRYDFNLISSVSYTSYKTLSNFDATTLEMRALLGYRGDLHQEQLTLGYQNDQGNAARPGGNRNGWSARLLGRRVLGAKFQGELDWNYQHWQGQSDYSPGLIDQRRRQNTTALRAMLIYPLSAGQALHLQWSDVQNHENISIFQYSSRQIQLSWHIYSP